ncbi:MAG: amino acid ABC transporter permease [Clostridiaceae bacterium]|jgi:polar amino acid transport system permease protein|nr:amino acid ABC transporter permease [Clostridiaceae bacterium]
MFDNIWEKFHRIFIVQKGYKEILAGLQNTIIIALGALVIGILLGVITAVIKILPRKGVLRRILHLAADIYITVIRGTPVVVQLLIAYFGIFAKYRVLDAITVAIYVFGINSGAYVAEIVRAGILAVDKGQMEAGRSLGLSFGTTMLKIILPQAIKNIIPALGNEFITLIKETSVAGFITVTDVTRASRSLAGVHYEAGVIYLVLAAVYLVLVLAATALVNLIEKELRKSDTR